MTATPPPAPDLYEAECAACHDRSMPGTHAALLLWEGEHRRLTRHGAFTASVYRPTPDTRPRCGGTPGNGGLLCFQHGIYHPQTSHVKACYCSGCADCAQPAPTPSGDDARRCEAGQFCTLPTLHDGDHSFAAALQEARDQIEAERERGQFDFTRAEQLKSRLREVEGERDALRDVEMAAREVIRILLGTEDQEPCGDCDPEELCAMHGALGDLSEALVDYATAQALLAIPTAASRPVPGVEIEITDTYGMRETFTDGSRAATPSTEEGGR